MALLLECKEKYTLNAVNFARLAFHELILYTQACDILTVRICEFLRKKFCHTFDKKND